ncbi:MAG TPA: Na+/H+ antiporter NhaC family protein [Vicinamibacteria bacterium]|nr:Na+/H+ antiporter NhaC family protein [Vicinamibacteria bacterium]
MDKTTLRFRGGQTGALAPFALFLAGVGWLGLEGAPDERGFWPVLLAALVLGVLLAEDRAAWSEALLRGMSQPVVALMIVAWLFAGCLGALLAASGLVESLVWLARTTGVAGAAYVGAAYLIACALSTSTGTSLGTLLLCGPLLYPAGAALGSDPAFLMGAILAGVTFGDSLSPISDTTIASAMTQGADVPGVVRARLKYALPAAAVALVVYLFLGGGGAPLRAPSVADAGSPRGLLMALSPVFVVFLLLRRRHLVESLLLGILSAVVLGLGFGLFRPEQLVFVDRAHYSARGLLLDGLERGVGVSVFTLLLMGLVSTLEATGLLDRLVAGTKRMARSPRRGEWLIVSVLSVAVLLTTHSVVAILTTGAFARETGESLGLTPYRRANLLDLTACTWPFLLPYFIPTILAASASAAGVAAGLPRLSPFTVGVHNAYSWALVLMVAFAVTTGFGRTEAAPA